jgi:hypothetical protein
MAELLPRQREELEFKDLSPRDVIIITTGQGNDACRYEFFVEDIRPPLLGLLNTTGSEGEMIGPVPFVLLGCGKWRESRHSLGQKTNKSFEPYNKGLVVGSFLWGQLYDENGMTVFDNPDEEISAIEVVGGNHSY